ncbi:MAG: hypothetical protein JWM93_1016, partial [Frankiales bacterium]|nr:hypothetical protein [Frankiales bacterium]
MSITTRTRRRLSAALAGAVATGGLVALATAPAHAAQKAPVSQVSLTWSLSDEQGGGAFFGGCNFLSAGKAGDTGSSRLWTEADGFHKAVDGNVTIEKPTANGTFVAPTWASKCLDKNGSPVTAGNVASTTGNRVKLSAGTGVVDPVTGAGTISWTGSFTSAFYGGLTYWSATDPKLTIADDGTGTLTATAGGYAASMADPTAWEALDDRTVTLATFKDVNIGETGFTATPTYLGTAVTGTTQVAKSAANEAYWGSFPQSFADFQKETGQSSYWYTSGGARDVAKPATAVVVTVPTPKVTVTKTAFLPNGAQTITVSGTGFDPSLATGTRPPFQGKQSGSYIAFGRYLDVWRPSAGAPSSARVNGSGASVVWAVPGDTLASANITLPSPGYTMLNADGTFTAQITVDRSAITSTAGSFGIYTYGGSGAVAPTYETFTPITFAKGAAATSTTISGSSAYGSARTATISVAGEAGAVAPTGTISATVNGAALGSYPVAGGTASFALPRTIPAGVRSVAVSYSGDDNYEASS